MMGSYWSCHERPSQEGSKQVRRTVNQEAQGRRSQERRGASSTRRQSPPSSPSSSSSCPSCLSSPSCPSCRAVRQAGARAPRRPPPPQTWARWRAMPRSRPTRLRSPPRTRRPGGKWRSCALRATPLTHSCRPRWRPAPSAPWACPAPPSCNPAPAQWSAACAPARTRRARAGACAWAAARRPAGPAGRACCRAAWAATVGALQLRPPAARCPPRLQTRTAPTGPGPAGTSRRCRHRLRQWAAPARGSAAAEAPQAAAAARPGAAARCPCCTRPPPAAAGPGAPPGRRSWAPSWRPRARVTRGVRPA
mmetsp:Transcript_21566/g.54889  ORF Transcript_21566/g.54889 Transcript_21566/m.54889 type:complete len:307 (-) Transcript_21566:1227-2147(-)